MRVTAAAFCGVSLLCQPALVLAETAPPVTASTVAPATAAAAPSSAAGTPVAAPAAAVQSSPLVAVAPPQNQTVLPSNSEVILSLNDDVSSKTVKLGHTFALSVAYDVMLNGYIVIPKGARATGQVSYRTGKGAFGKSAKMEIEMQYVDVGGRRIPLEGKFRQEGEGNTGATVGTAVAVGIFSAFVTGRSAVFAKDREFKAHTKEAIPVQLAAGPVPVQIPHATIQPGVLQPGVAVSAPAPAVAQPAVLTQTSATAAPVAAQ
jgi:hypothetical protein